MPKSNQNSPKAVDAVRHVGPTLESEEQQPYVPAREQHISKEELAAESDLHIYRVETHDHKNKIIEEGKPGTETEPLHTHLAGDTSSDPHTDIGPETPKPVNKQRENAA